MQVYESEPIQNLYIGTQGSVRYVYLTLELKKSAIVELARHSEVNDKDTNSDGIIL